MNADILRLFRKHLQLIPLAFPHRTQKQLKEHDLLLEIQSQTGYSPFQNEKKVQSLPKLLQRREHGLSNPPKSLTHSILPISKGNELIRTGSSFFVGKFSPDGDMYFCASRDNRLRLFDTSNWKVTREIAALDTRMGWGFRPLDADYSPDQRWIIYSTRSTPYFYLVSIYQDWEVHKAIDCQTDSFGLFSINFSPDSGEVLTGCSDTYSYIYDLNLNQCVARLEGHEEDVNSAIFFEDNLNTILTGSDDQTILFWDRRVGKTPIHKLRNHTDGVNHLCSRKDGRYFLSTSKDQTIQLWDMRNISSNEPSSETPTSKPSSIMSYYGQHQISHTLIRAYFSPSSTTGQRYIVTGSSTNDGVIYDVLTGKCLGKLTGHTDIVRDVSWHPYLPLILTTSWDGSIRFHEPEQKE